MAANSQQGIRNVIQTLLSLLEDAGVPRIPSESFRKAKFNQPEVMDTFWIILYRSIELSNSLEHSKIISSTQIPSIKEISLSVKKHLFRLGYNRLNFFKHPNGSRELVLAFAWLLNKLDLSKKLANFHLKAANTKKIPLKTEQTFLVETMKKDIELYRNEVDQIKKDISNFDGKNLEQLQITLKKMVWLKGRLECHFKSALNFQEGFQNLSDKIHHYTWRPSHREHLSVHEVFLLRYPEQLALYLQELEKHLLAIQRLSEWENCESLFWQWMESVLDLAEKETAASIGNGDHVMLSVNNKELKLKIAELEREVSVLIKTNRTHIDKINRTWLVRRQSVGPDELEAELSKLVLTESPTQFDIHNYKNENTVFIEQLDCTDLPIRRPPREKANKSKRRNFLVPSSMEEDYSECLHSLEERSEQLKKELCVERERMNVAMTTVTRYLASIEHTLPPSVCKLE